MSCSTRVPGTAFVSLVPVARGYAYQLFTEIRIPKSILMFSLCFDHVSLNDFEAFFSFFEGGGGGGRGCPFHPLAS